MARDPLRPRIPAVELLLAAGEPAHRRVRRRLRGRSRLLVEVFEAVRAEWPERLPLSMRFGVTEFAPGGQTLDESVALARLLAPAASTSSTYRSAAIRAGPRRRGTRRASWSRRRSAPREAGVLTAANWNLADPVFADAIVREGQVDLVMLGRPMLANPHWPVYAAMVLGEERPYDMLPVQFSTWLNKYQRSRVNNGFGRIVVRRAGRPSEGGRVAAAHPFSTAENRRSTDVAERTPRAQSQRRPAAGAARLDHGAGPDPDLRRLRRHLRRLAQPP